MTQPPQNPPRRRADGSIDIDFYARRAERHRKTAATEMIQRLVDRLRAAWRGGAKLTARSVDGGR